MAQVPPAPWSRWDAPGYQYVSNHTESPLVTQNDAGFHGNQTAALQGRPIATATLIRQILNPDNPNFLQCIYGWSSSTQYIVEQCPKSSGCCEKSCCISHRWEQVYAWALALIILFCVLVILSLGLTLFCWLSNRAKDKQQKKLISESVVGMSPEQSQMEQSVAISPAEGGYYPYVGGPYQY